MYQTYVYGIYPHMDCVREEMVVLPTRRKGIRGPLLRFARGCAMMPSFWITLMVSFLCNLKDSTASDTPYDDLEYCGHDNSVRKIPPLADSLKDFDLSLSIEDVNMLQVQVFLRHGARTPISNLGAGLDPNNCWENYNETWDCNAASLIQPSIDRNDELLLKDKQTALFRKVYGDYGLGTLTVLKGTCAFGQLLDEGFDQQTKNGEILRDAYVCEGGGCLLNSNKIKDLEDASEDLWLTSDDVPRTIMSGQILTSALFDTKDTVEEGNINILEWRTGDASIEHMFDWHAGCPRVEELGYEWGYSEEYKALINSEEAMTLKDILINDWGVHKENWKENPTNADEVWRSWEFIFDCTVTTVCTGRELPSQPEPRTVYRLLDFVTLLRNGFLFFKSSIVPKIYFSPLLTRMRDFALNPTVNANGQHAPKFVLFSLHDSSLMSLLNVLASDGWNRKWTPYASMVVIEIMRISGKGYFRLIYNGKLLKPAGCKKDICSIDILESITSFVTDPKVSCIVVEGRDDAKICGGVRMLHIFLLQLTL